MAKQETFKSCKGPARYPYLSRPDTAFDAEGKYSIDLELDPQDGEASTFLALLKGKLTPEFSGAPYREQEDKERGKTGLYVVKFASRFKPKVFDVYGNVIPDDVEVGSGSVVVVAYSESFYSGFGGGMNLYLQAVQVIDLVEYTGNSAEGYGFDTATSLTEDPAPFEAGESIPKDNLPF